MQWEYTSVSARTFDIDEFMLHLNAAGSLGWEVVAVAAVDPTIGINRLTAILKRPAHDWPPPDATEPGWYNDPTSRHSLRNWDGMRWTEHVHDAGGGSDTDYPNRR
jgi:hypothetical protein